MSSVIAHLMRHGEQTAEQVELALGLTHEEAYTDLVRAEADGLVRVNVDGYHRCTWDFAHDWPAHRPEARP